MRLILSQYNYHSKSEPGCPWQYPELVQKWGQQTAVLRRQWYLQAMVGGVNPESKHSHEKIWVFPSVTIHKRLAGGGAVAGGGAGKVPVQQTVKLTPNDYNVTSEVQLVTIT